MLMNASFLLRFAQLVCNWLRQVAVKRRNAVTLKN
jgi:hypothetical protein